MTMELSMTLALVSALAIGEVFTTLVIMLFVAEVLEGLTVGWGRKAIRDLLDLLPRSVVVRREGGSAEIGAEESLVERSHVLRTVTTNMSYR